MRKESASVDMAIYDAFMEKLILATSTSEEEVGAAIHSKELRSKRKRTELLTEWKI